MEKVKMRSRALPDLTNWEIEQYLKQNCQKGDLLITMGAGDVYLIGESLLSS